MKAASEIAEDKVGELLLCLDRDIQYIQQNLSRLNELRGLVIKRDDASLGKLLESIRAESDNYTANESKRQSLRKELADTFGCDIRQMTLSSLEDRLSEEGRAQVTRTKTKLRLLVKEFKKEHLSTALLLLECSRFNNLLLKSIFDLGKTAMVYYNSDGSAKRHSDTAFVNLQF
jgi:hypothetical protein